MDRQPGRAEPPCLQPLRRCRALPCAGGRTLRPLWLPLLALTLAALSCGDPLRGPKLAGDGGRTPDGSLVVRRGSFRERVLLTGELRAARAKEIAAPRTPSWQLQIRWMEADGTEVAAGQKILEFDNSTFAGELEEKRSAAARLAGELEQLAAELALQEAEKVFSVEARRIERAKAEVRAAVPAGLLSRRDHQERQLELERVRSEQEKTADELAAFFASAAADLAVRGIELAKARREVEVAERSIADLTLQAPAPGVLVVAEHPWEGRKFQVGDVAWAGLTIMRVPDLASLEVEALASDVDDGKVERTMAGECTLDAHPQGPVPCAVEEVSPVAQELSWGSLRRAFRVRLALAAVNPETMRPGMSVRVELERPGPAEVLLAPRAGLDLEAEPPRARLAGGATVELRLGTCSPSECVVEAGLAEGARLRPPSARPEKTG